MTYELWSKVSRSIVGAFDTERAALAAVREAAETHGRAYAESLAVIREDSRGRSKPIAEGVALVDRAVASVRHQNRIAATRVSGR